MVVGVDGREACLQYMCQTGNLYDWPDDEDQSWQDVNDIICDMPQPIMSNRGHLTFPENLVKKAEEKSMEQEFVTCVHLHVLFVVYGSIMFKNSSQRTFLFNLLH